MSTEALSSKCDEGCLYLLAEFGNERLKKVFADNPGVSPDDMFDVVMKAMKAWKDASLPDFSDQDEDDMDEDEDDTGGEIGDESERPGAVKRPHASAMEGEQLECKKPRIAQGEEPQSTGGFLSVGSDSMSM